MACPVNIMSVDVLDNPSAFSNPLQFEIQYECLTALEKDLEWRLVYVGSAESSAFDQLLDSVLVGPVFPGQYRFVFQADAPDPSKLPQEDIVGTTGILLSCCYNDQEFVRVGYYVNNEYDPASAEAQMEEPPRVPVLEKLVRNILADKPLVTRYPVEFDAAPAIPSAADMDADGMAEAAQRAMEADDMASPSVTAAVIAAAAAPAPAAEAAGSSGMQLADKFAAAADAPQANGNLLLSSMDEVSRGAWDSRSGLDSRGALAKTHFGHVLSGMDEASRGATEMMT